MKRVHENIKEFQNGNLSIRFPVEYRMKTIEKLLTNGGRKNERIRIAFIVWLSG